MADETYESNPLLESIVEVLREGQQKGVINTRYRTAMLVHLINTTAQMAFVDWIYQGKKSNLTEVLPVVFEIIWNAIGQDNV